MVRLASRMPDMKKGFYGFFEPPPPGVVRFTVGEPDFDTPRPIVDAAIKALDDGDTHYVPPPQLSGSFRVSFYIYIPESESSLP